jgi:hypothetical protein
MKLRDRILRARPESLAKQAQAGDESPANDALSAEVTVTGPAATGERRSRWTIRKVSWVRLSRWWAR